MSEGNRLCSLEVSVAGHNGFAVLFSLVGNNLNKTYNEIFYIDNLFFEVKLDVNCNLIVTAS